MPSSCFLLDHFNPRNRDRRPSAATAPLTTTPMHKFPANNDIARAMFYLYCTTTACGLDVLPEDLVDFDNYDKLSPERRDAVILATWAFSPAVMKRKTLFEDTAHVFLQSRRAKILIVPVEDARHHYDVRPMLHVHGMAQRPTAVVLYKSAWLDGMVRSLASHRHVMPLFTRALRAHCPHCLWPGACQCRTFGTPRRRECTRDLHTICTPYPGNLRVLPNHCAHCVGHPGRCKCIKGCARGDNVYCFPVVADGRCSECGRDSMRVLRVRFACCSFAVLVCDACYRAQSFAWWHAFVETERASGRHQQQAQQQQMQRAKSHVRMQPMLAVAGPAAVPRRRQVSLSGRASARDTDEGGLSGTGSGSSRRSKRPRLVAALALRFERKMTGGLARTGMNGRRADAGEDGSPPPFLLGDRVVLADTVTREERARVSGVVMEPHGKAGYARVSLDADERMVCVRNERLKKIS